MGINKSQQAFLALCDLLAEIIADRKLSKSEIERLIEWRSDWKTVVKRPVLKPFTDWFDAAIADGVISKEEAVELYKWSKELARDPEHEVIQSRRLAATEQWRTNPVSEPQVQYLVALGVDEAEALRMTKGQASDRITQLQDGLPATDRQISFLEELGVPRSETKSLSKGRASELIELRLDEGDRERFAANPSGNTSRDARGRFQLNKSGCVILVAATIGSAMTFVLFAIL